MNNSKSSLQLAWKRYQIAGTINTHGKTEDEVKVMRKEYEESCIAYSDLLQKSIVTTKVENFINPGVTEIYSCNEYIDLSIAANRSALSKLANQ